jgi:tRNA/tmRNA/rRNA uracil-C5-methylase (TrmA/RlmC/RlmD family)
VSNQAIPGELGKFIARYIQSVEQVEILCLMSENPGRSWSEGEVLRAIQSSQESVSNNLRHFTVEHFLTTDSQQNFRFAPENPELAALVAELVKTYRERRVAIVELIYQAPSDTVRNFADAFRIRKEKP